MLRRRRRRPSTHVRVFLPDMHASRVPYDPCGRRHNLLYAKSEARARRYFRRPLTKNFAGRRIPLLVIIGILRIASRVLFLGTRKLRAKLMLGPILNGLTHRWRDFESWPKPQYSKAFGPTLKARSRWNWWSMFQKYLSVSAYYNRRAHEPRNLDRVHVITPSTHCL